MPQESRQCFLCGRSSRVAKSLLMVLDCAEQERRIRNGFLRRYEREIIGPVLGSTVHRICYGSIIRSEPLASTRSRSNPQKYSRRRKAKQPQSQDPNLSPLLSPVLPSFPYDEDALSFPVDDPMISAEQAITQHASMMSCADADVNIRVRQIRSESHHDQENDPVRNGDDCPKKMFQYESSTGLSECRRPAPLSDHTNIRSLSTVPFDNVDPLLLSMPLNLCDRLIRVDNGENSLTFNSASSREDIPFDEEFDEANFDLMCHTADIPSLLSIDIDLDDASSRENDDDRMPDTSVGFHLATIESSIGAPHSHVDLDDDFWSDTDTDIDSESPLAASGTILLNGSILPMTSTEKTIRAKAFVHRARFANSIIDLSGIDPDDRCASESRSLAAERRKRRKKLNRKRSKQSRCHRYAPSMFKTPISSVTDCDAASRLFTNGFDELCGWLFNLLEGGSLVPMVEIAAEYEHILKRRREHCTESMLRTTYIRDRLEARYETILHFEKMSNYEGTVVALTDVSSYVRLALSTSDVWTRPTKDDTHCQQEISESMMSTIDQLRKSIKDRAFLLRQFKADRQSIVEFDSGLFWGCVPLLLKNFIGLLTLSENKYKSFKSDYGFYDLTTKDLFVQSSKSLKVASISYDIINAQDGKAITPKHLLLGNELFHQTRSAHLLTITNRLGHTCAYDTILRLQHDAAERARQSSNPINFIRQQKTCHRHDFVVKVADNFDENPDGIHGDVKSIHILNQIFVSTQENDEVPIIVRMIISDLVDKAVEFINGSSVIASTCGMFTSSPSSLSTALAPYSPYIDTSFTNALFGYALAKLSVSLCLAQSLPMLSGFFATYLHSDERPLHTVTFLTPINEDPSSESTAEACLQSTKEALLDSNYQCEAVLVVDEKIYRSCVKVKRRRPDCFRHVTIYAGDFHLMKNTMIVIWDVLEGSGVEEVVGLIYKGASLRAVLNVHHFNKSLRCCKLLYTALMRLLLESFFAADSNHFDGIQSILQELPNEFSKCNVKQHWFSGLLDEIQRSGFSDVFRTWCVESAKKNPKFKLWSFVIFSLLEPLIELYMAIRTCNFAARNAALSRIAPLFFSTNHRNYARLCAQHLVDLKAGTPYLLDRLSRAFAVNRSNRPFSSIALDQTIECTINKYGKSRGGIDGRFDDKTIDQWINSFAFRALASTVMHEICQLETAGNSIDSHAECSPHRQQLDENDLTTIGRNLRGEDLFDKEKLHCSKLRSGMIFHEDIIESVCSLYERGSEALMKYIDDRLVDKVDKIPIDAPLKAMARLKFIDADTYVPDNLNASKKSQPKDIGKIIKEADEEIRRVIVIAQQRHLPLGSFFAHEFCPTSLALCDSRNINLLNQQSKAIAIGFIREIYPSAFHSTYPVSIDDSALVIDGGSLLETKPSSSCRTIRDYAEQLLNYTIGSLFKAHRRIDIVFDTGGSKTVKMFIRRHEKDTNVCGYQLKGSDKLESPFAAFVHSNRAALASCVRQCWCDATLINTLPVGCLLVVGGPDTTAVKLENGTPPMIEDMLESNHVEADTRMMLHMNVVKIDGQQKMCIVQSTDTDVILLAIAFGSSIGLNHVFVKSFDTRSKKNTIIDARSIALDMRQRLKIDPIILLILHALSGCDTTSFVKNITKKKFFSTFFKDPARYSRLISLVSTPPSKESIAAAEKLLIACYSSRCVANSLDELRAHMAMNNFKERGRKSIAANLPPSSMAFYHHCLRASRQIVIWLSSFEQYMNPPAMTISGYKPTELPNRLAIEWTSVPAFSDDLRLVTCGQCSSGCSRCKCGVNKLSCTFYCQCKAGACTNQSNIHMNLPLPISETNRDNDSDEDSNRSREWLIRSDEEDGNESTQSTGATSESDFSDSGDERLLNGPINVNNYPPLPAVQHTARTDSTFFEHVQLDHSYCTSFSDDYNQRMTPQRRNSTNDYLSDSSADSPQRMKTPNHFSTSNSFDPQKSRTSKSSIFKSPRCESRFLNRFRV